MRKVWLSYPARQSRKFAHELFRAARAAPADLIPVLLYTKQYGNITNTAVQQQLAVSKPTATRYLGELEKGGYLQKTGTRGAGTEYRLIGS